MQLPCRNAAFPIPLDTKASNVMNFLLPSSTLCRRIALPVGSHYVMISLLVLRLLLLFMLDVSYQVHAQSSAENLAISSAFDDSARSSASNISVRASNNSTSTSSTNAAVPTPQLDAVHDMCWRLFHQSTIKNGSLYVDGGIQSFIDDDADRWASSSPPIYGYNYHLIKIDLSQPFDWKTWDVETSEVLLNKTADPDTNNMPPQVSCGALFTGVPTENRIWLYGGTTIWWNTSFPRFELPSTAVYSLWSFDTVSLQWDQHDVTSESPMRPSSGLAAEAPDLGLAFYFNGEINSGSSIETQPMGNYEKAFLEGMVVINSTSQTASNVSTVAAVGHFARTRGGAAYIPNVGGSGILVLIGGTFKPSTVWDEQEMAMFARMDNITVFDVGSYLRNSSEQLWYSQNATGDIPEPRANFCTLMVSAADNSSHNIYLYSGQGPNQTVYDDVYVLSVPSFTWTKVFSGNSPRYGHTCHQVGDQMITVGGRDKVDDGQQIPCDWETAGLAIFNLSSLQWGSKFKPKSQAGSYSVPDEVRKQIVDPQGTTALTRPANGWTDKALGRVFGDSTAGKAKLSGGAIAGIVVGTIVAVALIAAGCWYAWRRWQNRAKVAPHGNVGQPAEWQAPDRGEAPPMREQTNAPVVAT